MGLADDRKPVNLMTVHVSKSVTVHEVSNTRDLPTTSFRFHLTVNTLAVQLYISHYLGMFGTFHPLERAHGAHT